MDYKVDYHMHSCYSDGALEPLELVQRYHAAGYDEIALTDHDVTDGLNEFIIAGKALKIQVIAGIEFSAFHGERELHILGYKFDKDNPALKEKIETLKEYRRERNEKLVAALQKEGIDISMEELYGASKSSYIGKPDIARLLAKKGYVKKPKEAFEPGRFLESPVIKAIEKKRMTSEEAVQLISQAGGMAVLAHPGKIKGIGPRESDEFWESFEKLLKELKRIGLKGLECIYPEHSEEEKSRFIALAAKYHLHITEGSDFHGEDFK